MRAYFANPRFSAWERCGPAASKACRRCTLGLWVISISLACAGCAGAGRTADIPLGQWNGRGKFVYESWPSDDPAATQPAADVSIQREYPTSLRIRESKLDGKPVVELDILSERGDLPELGSQTHLVVALDKMKVLPDSTVLYRVVGKLFNPDPDQPMDWEDDAPRFAASSALNDGAIVLRIDYDDNFSDAYQFRGNVLQKAGGYRDKGGMIHWVETLQRR